MEKLNEKSVKNHTVEHGVFCGSLHHEGYYDVPKSEGSEFKKHTYVVGHYVGTCFRIDGTHAELHDAMIHVTNLSKVNEYCYQVLSYSVNLSNVYQIPFKL